MPDLDTAPRLTGQRLHLRPLGLDDRDGLARAAGDPAIWEQHPARQRHRREVFDPYFDFLLGAGGTLVAIDRAAETIVGCSRYYPVPDAPDDIGIGFTFLARSHWGGAWNAEMKALMLDHAFRQVDRVWFHIAPGNMRSHIATTRFGARFMGLAVLDLGTGASDLRCYVLDRAEWTAR